MTPHSNTHPDIRLPSREAVMAKVAEHRYWFIALGVLLNFTGLIALVFPLAFTLAVEMIVAWVFLIAGIAHLVHAFGTRGWGNFALQILGGLIYLAAGVVLLARPVEGTAFLTLVVAATFIVDGMLRTIMAFAMDRGTGWGWMLAGGVLSIVLGMAIFALFPGSALWLLGVLVGINFIGSGIGFVVLAVAAGDAADETERFTEQRSDAA